jgi:hypothetical protein
MTLETHGPRLPLGPHRAPPSFSQIVSRTLQGKQGVSFRRYGLHGDQQRPIIHRFDHTQLRGTVPLQKLMLDSVVRGNALLQRLNRKGR